MSQLWQWGTGRILGSWDPMLISISYPYPLKRCWPRLSQGTTHCSSVFRQNVSPFSTIMTLSLWILRIEARTSSMYAAQVFYHWAPPHPSSLWSRHLTKLLRQGWTYGPPAPALELGLQLHSTRPSLLFRPAHARPVHRTTSLAPPPPLIRS